MNTATRYSAVLTPETEFEPARVVVWNLDAQTVLNSFEFETDGTRDEETAAGQLLEESGWRIIQEGGWRGSFMTSKKRIRVEKISDPATEPLHLLYALTKQADTFADQTTDVRASAQARAAAALWSELREAIKSELPWAADADRVRAYLEIADLGAKAADIENTVAVSAILTAMGLTA